MKVFGFAVVTPSAVDVEATNATPQMRAANASGPCQIVRASGAAHRRKLSRHVEPSFHQTKSSRRREIERTLAVVPARASRVATSETMRASAANTIGKVAASGAKKLTIVIDRKSTRLNARH